MGASCEVQVGFGGTYHYWGATGGASQLGLRFRVPGNRVTGELTFRHWSNGGIRLPFNLDRSLAANSSGPQRQLFP